VSTQTSQSVAACATKADEPGMKKRYKEASRLAGNFMPLKGKQYRVSFKRLANKRDARRTLLLATANVGVEVGFLTWLLISLLKPIWDASATIGAAFIALLICIFVIESFRLISIIAFSMSALWSRNPVPVRPKRGDRVAFTTTIVPAKEPFEMVRKTLEAMKQVQYNGTYDVWLLDEGNSPAIKKACREMGVRHFSRKGKAAWNTESGRFRARTKHGNHNAWLAAHGAKYDYVLSVDSDHIPHPSFAKRMLGYFRDPDVAYVVGPQVYGNTETVIARGAESQSYVFQATIQRAANAYGAAMFVGTNHAYRVTTMMQIDGFQDSITEDLLTGMKIHSTRNPDTGKFWKSVYTPDVLAIGEGPSSWTDFFSQQLRWARGANETLLKHFVPMFIRLPWGARLHYGLIIWCYPAAAITWTVGIAVSMLYLFLGTTGVGLQDKTWLALYADVLAAQVILYAWLRRYNVSPHEEKKSFGISGILFSIFAAPVYAVALFSTLTRRKSGFVVTAKGDTTSPDHWLTFKYHIFWATLVGGFLGYTILIGNTHPNVKIWCVIALTSCLAPLIMWRITVWPQTRRTVARFLRTPIRIESKYHQKGVEA
jgi:cellulose synthase/poly-beta-1,6-N-acetylglucosamine synthase-like glycosyltransferase